MNTTDLVTILKALYFYEEKLGNTSSEFINLYEYDQVRTLRKQLGNQLKSEALIE